MKIMEKIKAKALDNAGAEGITLAFIGDSVTQGCFEIYNKADGNIETIFDKTNAYHKHLADMLAVLYPSVPVSIINAGISGGSAPRGLARLERDIIRHQPDLTVVCFGLNDCSKGMEGIGDYTGALTEIFDQLLAAGSEVIFMTPNMMCTKVSCHIKEQNHIECAEMLSKKQNEGILDAYVEAAKKVAEEKGVAICDCYAKWKRLYECGADITELLANKINHPTREMNKLFAVSLLETMMQ